MLKLKKENIPMDMQMQKKWVAFVIRNGKKIPIDPKPESGQKAASISNPDTWGSFEQAVNMVEHGRAHAIGYAMTVDDVLVFIDVDYRPDRCTTKEEREEQERNYKAMVEAVKQCRTYMEQSISGDGVHVLAKGSISDELKTGASPLMPIELYGNGDKRFIIMTGHKMNEFDIEDSDYTIGVVRNIHKNYFPKKSSSSYTSNNTNSEGLPAAPVISPIEEPIRSDEEVIRLILKDKKAELLWNDNWTQVLDENGNCDYDSQHYSDCGLMRKICFYTGNCPSQMNRVFRKSPCFQNYGTKREYIKYESDIRNDIKTVSSTCEAVYDPGYYKKNTTVAKVKTKNLAQTDIGMGIPLINPLEWKPDYYQLEQQLYGKIECSFNNPVLKNILRDYIEKYKYQPICYYAGLYKEDKNINGGTNIVQRVLGENFKYSYNFGQYFIWNGKQYKATDDPDTLIHPITVALGLVEHSVFEWVINYVGPFQNPEPADGEVEINTVDGNGSKPKPTPKDYLEEKAVKLFEYSKKFVSRPLAQDILKKYKGMSIGDDIVTYYETPYINMQNGMFNMVTREFTPFHSPGCNLYKITNCDYDPNAGCPEFRAMMERLIPDGAERKELQKAFGLCLAKEQVAAKKIFVMLIGPKDSGKSFLLNTLVDTLGEYAISIDNSLLMQTGRDTTKGPEMYDFKDNLMITASETNDANRDKLNSTRIKGLTGDTTQSIRNLFSKKMDKFKMIGLIYIDSNAKPFLDPRDPAIHDRLRLFELPNAIKVKDPNLKVKLEAERSGIFNWLLEGLDMVLEEKEVFETPDMLARKKAYKDSMDTVEQFLKDCIEKVDDNSIRIPTSMLFTAYKNWAKDNGFKDSVRNKFYEEIGKIFEKKKSGVEYFTGLRFTELGSLYSTMLELTTQDFAKKKRRILEGSSAGVPYTVIRKVHYEKSKEWFYKSREVTGDAAYIRYCCWCAENALIPLRQDDYNAKAEYLKKSIEKGYVSNQVIETLADIWGDR